MEKFISFLSEYKQTKLAAELGIGQTAVSNWVRRRKIPAERVPDISRISGIPRDELRPDIFSTENA